MGTVLMMGLRKEKHGNKVNGLCVVWFTSIAISMTGMYTMTHLVVKLTSGEKPIDILGNIATEFCFSALMLIFK